MAEKIKEVKQEPNTTASKKKKVDLNKELVTIRLFKDSGKYKDDVFVSINGKGWQIKRGEDVTVPKSVALVIEESLKQDESTASLIERETKEKVMDF